MKKKVMAVIGGAVLLGAGIAGGFLLDNPATIVKEVQVPYPVVTEKVVMVEVPGAPVVETQVVYQNVSVEDTSFAQLMCDRMLFEDLEECKVEVIAEDSALKMAIDFLESDDEVFNYLEDVDMIRDDNRASVLKVYDDFDKIEILRSRYDDSDYRFLIKARIYDDRADEKFYANFELSVEDGYVEIRDVTLVE